jgi:hypothetical protein
MNTDPEKFKISLEGVTYTVERSMSDKNIYRLRSAFSSYLIARDFYGIWVELTSSSNSPDISLTKIGKLIENHYKVVNPL